MARSAERPLDVTLLDGGVWTLVTSLLRKRERQRERDQEKHLCCLKLGDER